MRDLASTHQRAETLSLVRLPIGVPPVTGQAPLRPPPGIEVTAPEFIADVGRIQELVSSVGAGH